MTFDDNILGRQTDVNLCSPAYGATILPDGKVLMKLKCSGGIPLWMVDVLSRERIYKTAFSKYGTAYSTSIFPEKLSKTLFPQKEIIVYGSNL